MDKKEKHWD